MKTLTTIGAGLLFLGALSVEALHPLPKCAQANDTTLATLIDSFTTAIKKNNCKPKPHIKFFPRPGEIEYDYLSPGNPTEEKQVGPIEDTYDCFEREFTIFDLDDLDRDTLKKITIELELAIKNYKNLKPPSDCTDSNSSNPLLTLLKAGGYRSALYLHYLGIVFTDDRELSQVLPSPEYHPLEWEGLDFTDLPLVSTKVCEFFYKEHVYVKLPELPHKKFHLEGNEAAYHAFFGDFLSYFDTATPERIRADRRKISQAEHAHRNRCGCLSWIWPS